MESQDVLRDVNKENAYTVFPVHLALNNSIIYEVIIMHVERGERVKKLYFFGSVPNARSCIGIYVARLNLPQCSKTDC